MSEKEKILIVDDDEGTYKTLSLIFSKKAHEIKMARTGEEAQRENKENYRSIFNTAKE